MKKLSIPTLSAISGATAIVSLALRIISLFFFYDKIGYYQPNAILPKIANILLAIAIIFLLSVSLLSIDKKQSVEPTSKRSQYAALLPMGASLFHLFSIFTGVFNDTVINKYLMAASVIFTAIFFFLIAFAREKYNILTFYVGIGALLYVAFCWMRAYFEFFIPINSTDKTFFYLACAGAIIFIFNEMCACYGFVRTKFYYFSLFTSIITLSVASISAIVGYAFGIFEAYITLETDVFFIALLIYAIARLTDAQKSSVKIDKTIIETAEKATVEETDSTEAEENLADDSE